ncbi:ankyrin repeat domain-containing protein [bacterium]|nr:ankyrin repeat domain-containing protein [bacterium]
MNRYLVICMLITLLAGCSSEKPKTDNSQPRPKKVAVVPETQPKKSSEPDPDSIFSAAAKGQLASIMRYLDEGKNVDSQDEAGDSLLSWAALRGRAGVVKYLLEHNANPNLANKKKLTPLHKACLFGDENVIQILLDFGADVNLEGPGGTKAIEIARRMKHTEVVVLLEKAANKSADKAASNQE